MEYQGIIEAIDRLSQPTWVDISALIISLSQTLILAGGLQLMRRSADHRDKQHHETMTAMERQHEATMTAMDKQHEATMTAMDKQHEATMTAMDKQHHEDTRRHDQTMTAMERQHEEDTRRHHETMTALRALIERTGQSPH